jgi:hypothetical protein
MFSHRIKLGTPASSPGILFGSCLLDASEEPIAHASVNPQPGSRLGVDTKRAPSGLAIVG